MSAVNVRLCWYGYIVLLQVPDATPYRIPIPVPSTAASKNIEVNMKINISTIVSYHF
jgi:hypothetical protein